VAVRRAQNGRQAGKHELLDRALAHVSERGLRDTSLRAIAAELGTSHRMLIYHFGSAEDFWDAVVGRMRERDRHALREAARLGRVPLIEDTWARMSSRQNLPFGRLLFETYGHALRDPKRFRGFLSQAVDGSVEAIAAALHRQFRVTKSEARTQARLRLALLRGLLLDLLTTGDRAGTDAALSLFAARMRLAPRTQRKAELKTKATGRAKS
jgi:AcrR family transcriptional regulator